MMLVSMKKYPVLLWGLSVLFSMESKSASIPEISNSTSTAQLMTATEITNHLTTAHRRHHETEQQPAVVSKNNTAATQTPTHKPAETSTPATPESTLSHMMSGEQTVNATQTHSLNSSTAGVVVVNTLVETTSSSGPQVSHNSTDAPALTTVADVARPSHSVNISETENPTGQHHQSAVTSTGTSATTSETETVSSPQGKSKLLSTPDHSTQASFSIQDVNSSSVSTISRLSTLMSLISTAAPSHLFEPNSTSLTNTSTTSTGLPSMSQPISTTETRISSTGSPEKPGQIYTTESPTTTTPEFISTISSTSAYTVSTSPSAGVSISHIPKKLPATKSPTTTTTATSAKSPTATTTALPITEAHSCTSTRGVVKHCLIAIASLAALATIFMVSTITLCTKLSSRKYRVKNRQQETEMMCISSLLHETNYTYKRQRNPITNGVLVIPSGADSDDDGDDNLTLSSFLPENDRVL